MRCSRPTHTTASADRGFERARCRHVHLRSRGAAAADRSVLASGRDRVRVFSRSTCASPPPSKDIASSSNCFRKASGRWIASATRRSARLTFVKDAAVTRDPLFAQVLKRRSAKARLPGGEAASDEHVAALAAPRAAPFRLRRRARPPRSSGWRDRRGRVWRRDRTTQRTHGNRGAVAHQRARSPSIATGSRYTGR